MSTYRENRAWSDRFLPLIKRILGEAFLCEGPPEEDCDHNTDIMVLCMKPLRIACRVRRHVHLSRYGHQFTIRSWLASGRETELDKILAGWGDYLFYGFADAHDRGLAQWVIVSLRRFGWWVQGYRQEHGQLPGEEFYNGDGRSAGRAFTLAMLPRGIVYRHSGARVARALGGYGRGGGERGTILPDLGY